jgi:hypothetical protein
MNIRNTNIICLLLGTSLALSACGGGGGTSGSKLTDGAKSSRSALKGKKPSDAPKVTTSPKPDPFAGDSEGDETFTITLDDDIDLDGDGNAETGEVLFDEEGDTLFVWWSDEEDLVGDGTTVAYSALAWIAEEEVGIILELDNGAVLACVDGSESGCVVCDAEGSCSAEDLDADLAEDEEEAPIEE